MAKNTYKKRAKASWNQGKGCKGDSQERNYTKKDISEELLYDNEENLTPHKKKGKKNKKAQLEYWISWYTQQVEACQRDGKDNGNDNGMLWWFMNGLEQCKKEYEEKFGKKG
jgi:hypothetical protein